jgi:hypothetical protein
MVRVVALGGGGGGSSQEGIPFFSRARLCTAHGGTRTEGRAFALLLAARGSFVLLPHALRALKPTKFPAKRNKMDKRTGHQKTKENKNQTPTPEGITSASYFIGTTSSLRKIAQGAPFFSLHS